MDGIMALPLLGVTEQNAESYSIRLNKVMGHVNPWVLPREEIYDHMFRQQWSDREKNRRYRIPGKKVLQFLNLQAGSPLYVFMGAFEVGEAKSAGDGGFIYERSEEDPLLAPFSRRLVVRMVRDPGYQGMDFRLNHERFLKTFLTKMTVEYIRATPFSVQPFLGYDSVLLSHRELVAAVADEQWKTALNNVQAVYLQTDTFNGWHYVGSAYSKKGEHFGLLSRWTEYAQGDHTGDNALLKEIPNASEHIERYFQYSILEVFDMKTDPEVIIRREHWWMRVLSSVRKQGQCFPHGYNSL